MYTYKVVIKEESGKLAANLLEFNELTSKYYITGINRNLRQRKELQGQPTLEGFLGPMYDGKDENGNAVIRYESSEAYKHLSY